MFLISDAFQNKYFKNIMRQFLNCHKEPFGIRSFPVTLEYIISVHVLGVYFKLGCPLCTEVSLLATAPTAISASISAVSPLASTASPFVTATNSPGVVNQSSLPVFICQNDGKEKVRIPLHQNFTSYSVL